MRFVFNDWSVWGVVMCLFECFLYVHKTFPFGFVFDYEKCMTAGSYTHPMIQFSSCEKSTIHRTITIINVNNLICGLSHAKRYSTHHIVLAKN